jgi:hypothetical protein
MFYYLLSLFILYLLYIFRFKIVVKSMSNSEVEGQIKNIPGQSLIEVLDYVPSK